MHEHGLMTRLLRRATQEAHAHGARLRGLEVRLGALYGADEAHFRDELAHVCEELGLGTLALTLHLAPERPVGVELVRVELAEELAHAEELAEEHELAHTHGPDHRHSHATDTHED